MNNTLTLTGKKILLTGGLGLLGKIFSKEIIKNKGNLIILDNKEPTKSDLTFIKKNNIIFFQVDLTNYDSLIKLSKKKIFTNINCIINNAAIDQPPIKNKKIINFFNLDINTIEETIFTNIRLYLYTTQIFGNILYKKNKGNIINISSIYGQLSPDQDIYKKSNMKFEKPIAYSISKSSIYGFTKYLCHYFRGKNIRVNSLTLSGVYNNQNKKFIKEFTHKIPLKRMMRNTEAANVLVFMISDNSSYLNGSNLTVDGGYSVT